MTNDAVQFSNVRKRFGKVDALAGLTLAIPKGSVVGLLGRNGAGKTTALRCLVGLQVPDSGEVRVLGRDPMKLDIEMKQRIGFQSQAGVPFPEATVASCDPVLRAAIPELGPRAGGADAVALRHRSEAAAEAASQGSSARWRCCSRSARAPSC